MLTFSATQRIYLAVEPVDMRKQFNGLWTLAAQKLQEDPFSGALFVFVNKGRDRVKILFWDGSGVWVAAKRLEKGRFSWPEFNGGAKVNLEPTALTMLLTGIDLKDGCKKAWYER
ncbi:MAG: IS66 family insertion sequence element accessory protein TnpB [Opitutaceae bacterium]|jgi:transposase